MQYSRYAPLAILVLLITAFAAPAQTGFPSVEHFEPPPVFPPAALAVRAFGAVSVSVEVDGDGKVKSVQAFSGPRLLQKVSEIAVTKWTFSKSPGNHFLTITIQYLPPIRKQRARFEITGPYSASFVAPYIRIIQTPSYEGESASR